MTGPYSAPRGIVAMTIECSDNHPPLNVGVILDRRSYLPGCALQFITGAATVNGDVVNLPDVRSLRPYADGAGVTFIMRCPLCGRAPQCREDNPSLLRVIDWLISREPDRPSYTLSLQLLEGAVNL
ncbi:hypothetical protein ACTXG6_40405 [Pseudonocardia sp. Cha107L01]|uniref:hypothetical protein n=1 Tax=Pseudonocardia sp. Cha107L01 TaxID=3457576 RepID=UPI00403E9F40